MERSGAPGIYSEGVAQRGRRQSLSSRPSHIPGPPAAAGALPTCRLNEPIVTSPAAQREDRRPARLRAADWGETSDGPARERPERPAPRRRPACRAPPGAGRTRSGRARPLRSRQPACASPAA